ncbi:MAG: tryptophan synthase alpha chain [Myxococcota bacterium]
MSERGRTGLRAAFAAAAADRRKVLVPYITAGDPDLGVTADLLDAVVAGGADIIELGVPFTDPSADGPVLQLAAERALLNPLSLGDLLGLVAAFRKRHDTPLILFGYYNPFHKYGLEALARDAAAAGVDGVLCVDLPPEEAGPFVGALRGHGLCLIPLLTPVTPDDRILLAADLADGFGYYVSVTGVTGSKLGKRGPTAERVRAVRGLLGAPLVVGFGVRTPDDARAVGEGADGVVVGSALVQLAHESEASERNENVREFMASLSGALG